MCKRCNDTGRETVIEEDLYSCQWHQVTRPCRCTKKSDWPLIVFLGLEWILVFGLVLWQGLK